MKNVVSILFLSILFCSQTTCSVDEKEVSKDDFGSSNVNFDYDANEGEGENKDASSSDTAGKDSGDDDQGSVGDAGKTDSGESNIKCEDNSDCPTGYYCDYKCYKGSGSDCIDDEDCITGEECKAFKCRSKDIPAGEKDGPCLPDFKCNDGLVCDGGICIEIGDSGVGEDAEDDSGGGDDDVGGEDVGEADVSDSGDTDGGAADTSCKEKCAYEGQLICFNDKSYLACVKESGCLDWSDPITCAGSDKCYDGSCITTSCTLDDKRCNGKVVEVCQKNAEGKFTWSAKETCADECNVGACVCHPTCASKECGDDGCGGNCGGCSNPPDAHCDGNVVKNYNSTGSCNNNKCVYTPIETTCPTGCLAGPPPHCDSCTPNCTGKCGGAPDSCGGTCTASCGSGKTCVNQVCTACGGASQICCDSNTCSAGYSCEGGICKTTCIPDCTNKCGGANDGCGGTCNASCSSGEVCYEGSCCQPIDCSGRECGDNGCGGICGSGCSAGKQCSDDGKCIKVIYVKADATGSNDGTSWQNAFKKIQDALTASQSGAQIWVSAGTYVAATDYDNKVFTMKTGVNMYGGFKGTEASFSERSLSSGNETIIDGQGGNKQCVIGAGNTVIDGFTLKNCKSYANGGGISYNSVSGVTVSNCKITGNSASNGGGLYFNYVSSGTVDSVEIASNTVNSYGGGIYMNQSPITISKSKINGNTASGYGGGIYLSYVSSTTLDSVEVTSNTASSYGGGIHITQCTVVVSKSKINNNTSNSFGGGIYINYSSGTFTETEVDNNKGSDGGGIYNTQNNTFAFSNGSVSKNTASGCMGGGGGIFNDSAVANFKNTIFVQNNASCSYAGAVYNNYDKSRSFINCTFYGNATKLGGASIMNNMQSKPVITNCIMWGGTGPNGELYDYPGYGSASSATYNDIKGGFTGTGNIDADPLFVNAGQNDFRLNSGSPCIDAANGAPAPATDKNGNSRFDDPNTNNTGAGTPNYVDIGAYEYQNP